MSKTTFTTYVVPQSIGIAEPGDLFLTREGALGDQRQDIRVTPVANGIWGFDSTGAFAIVTAINVSAGLTSSGATGAGVGYSTGAGGAVTQITSASTSVTLNKLTGAITTVALTLAAGVDVSFTLTNSTIAATDVVVASVKSYGGTADGIPVVSVTATAAGSCVLNIRNTGAVTLDALAVINFAVIKAVAA